MPHILRVILLFLLTSSSVNSAHQEETRKSDPILSLGLEDIMDQLLDMLDMEDLLSRGRALEDENLPVYLKPFSYWLQMLFGLTVFGVFIPGVYIMFMLNFLINIFIATPITSLWGLVAGM